MTAATYPARHEAIRKVLMERGYTQENRTGTSVVAVTPAIGTEGWHCTRGIPPWFVRLPVYPFDDYDEECERIEIKLGLRLPPEVQKHVVAERERCIAIIAAQREWYVGTLTIESDPVARARAEEAIDALDECDRQMRGVPT